MPKKDYSQLDNKELIVQIQKLEKRKKYGLVWDVERIREQFEREAQNSLPVLDDVPQNEIVINLEKPTHILIEGDNYHALSVLNYTHEKSVDVIYIDPPYNTGEDEFKFNDKYVGADDTFRHSKWLSFMDKRIRLARNLLRDTGIIIIHIDEHEVDRLYLLLCDIFSEENDLGRIIWDKRNPKGDSKGVSILHETILFFAKNKIEFLNLPNTFIREKPNAEKILNKAKRLFQKLGKLEIPDDVKEILNDYKVDKKLHKHFQIKYDLEQVNAEFQRWLRKQDFSGGEKAYKYIDENGYVYQSVSMAWPNKKTAPKDYFIPLIHPKTKKTCPVPERGWRYPPSTMKAMLADKIVIFGVNEKTQPRRKYRLDENMLENIPSIYSYGGSDDAFQTNIGVEFPYSKPLEVAKYLLKHIHPEPKTVLDFFAGSGTTGHAVLEINYEETKNIEFILCTNNENEIATKICYPRLKKVIKGYKGLKNKIKTDSLAGNLKYYRTSFVPNSSNADQLKIDITKRCTEMLCLKEGIFKLTKEHSRDGEIVWKIFSMPNRFMAVYYDFAGESLETLRIEMNKLGGKKLLYCFTTNPSGINEYDFDNWNNIQLESIPQKILDVYRRIKKEN